MDLKDSDWNWAVRIWEKYLYILMSMGTERLLLTNSFSCLRKIELIWTHIHPLLKLLWHPQQRASLNIDLIQTQELFLVDYTNSSWSKVKEFQFQMITVLEEKLFMVMTFLKLWIRLITIKISIIERSKSRSLKHWEINSSISQSSKMLSIRTDQSNELNTNWKSSEK